MSIGCKGPDRLIPSLFRFFRGLFWGQQQIHIEIKAPITNPSCYGTTNPEAGSPDPYLNAPVGLPRVSPTAAGTEIDPFEWQPLLASLIFLMINGCFGYINRSALERISPPLLRRTLCSVSATMEESAYYFEFGLINEHYGDFWFFFAIVLQNLLTSHSYSKGEGFPNPLLVVNECYLKNMMILHGAIIIVFQLFVGGILSYWFAMSIWMMGMTPEHTELSNKTDCSQIVKNETGDIVGAFFVEGVPSMVDTWLGVLLPSMFISDFIYNVAMAAVVVVCTPMTGGFFNPAMAVGHLAGCPGQDAPWFIAIYVAGPLAATWLAMEIVSRYGQKPHAD